MNIGSDFSNNKKLFLFLIILLVGFVCIGSSFAADMNDSSSLNDVLGDSSLHISTTNANANNDVVNDVDSNNHIESSSISQSSSSVVNAAVSESSNVVVSNVSISQSSSSVVNAAVSESSNYGIMNSYHCSGNKAFVYSENDIRRALGSNCSEIIFNSNINITNTIKISKNNIKIDGHGYSIKLICPETVATQTVFAINGSNVTIYDLKFNHKKNTYVRAIYGGFNCIIKDCIFDSCIFLKDNAVIENSAYAQIVNCAFYDCTRGVLCCDGCKIINSNFIKIHSSAIFITAPNSDIINCGFLNCIGAINIVGKGENCTTVNCDFINCSEKYGGAFCSVSKNSVINNCSFVNCSASSDGGAVYCSGADSVVNGCNFINCSASGSGGAVYCDGADSVVRDCTFYNATSNATEGKVIYMGSVSNQVLDCDFYIGYLSTYAIGWDNGIRNWFGWLGDSGLTFDCRWHNLWEY